MSPVLEILTSVFSYLLIGSAFYTIPYLIRRGWGDAQSRTVRVCDVCFRGIKEVNDVVKELQKINGLAKEADVLQEKKNNEI